MIDTTMRDTYKFGWIPNEEQVFTYGNVWAVENTTGPDRLIIAPYTSQIDVLRSLLKVLLGPCWILYVLVVPRSETQAGRYQSEQPILLEDVDNFLIQYREYLEGDGRMNLWIASTSGSATLVYDRHNVIFAYGPLSEFEEILSGLGLTKVETVSYPVPHTHHYHEHFDMKTEQILEDRPWIYSPLKESDEN